MPSEIRRLVFYHSELADALRLFGARHRIDFPDGKIIKTQLANRAGFGADGSKSEKQWELLKQYNVRPIKGSIIVTFYEEATLEHRSFNVPAEFISAALLEYCISRSIPLPKHGKKKIDLTEFNICMDIVVDDSVDDSVLQLSD